MSGRMKTTLPIAQQLLEPEVPPDVKKKLILKRRKAKKYFDKGAKELPELVIGVRVKPVVKKSKVWQREDNNIKRSHTQLDSRKQVIAFQDRVITINIKEAQHPLK